MRVNVERALALGDRMGGHLVQGHVDTTGTLVSATTEGEFAVYRWSHPSEYAPLVVNKGSIAVDGVSLTIADLVEDAFGVALVPHTLEATTLSSVEPGLEVNLEVDVLAKYVERLLGTRGA